MLAAKDAVTIRRNDSVSDVVLTQAVSGDFVRCAVGTKAVVIGCIERDSEPGHDMYEIRVGRTRYLLTERFLAKAAA